MSDIERGDQSEQKPKAEHADDSARIEGASSFWWYVWVPVIVAITLWIGGWWFGNYGGPWRSKPRPVQINIGDCTNTSLSVNNGSQPSVGLLITTRSKREKELLASAQFLARFS
jgi:hypothetical protein